MGIVGVNSTVGRAVKCIDPGKTTKSESSWLGYTLCDLIHITPLPVFCGYRQAPCVGLRVMPYSLQLDRVR